MARAGAPVSGAYRAISDLSFRLHRRNEAEIFVATVQSLGGSGIATVHDLLSSGRWMLAADEFHRYADENTWGEAIKSLSPVFTAAVSATPDRTDRSAKAIDGKADVEISLADAGVVEFVARCRDSGRAQRMHETSRFVREQGRWYYVDGIVDDEA